MVVRRIVIEAIAVLIVPLFALLRAGEAQSPPPLVRVGFLSASVPAADRMRPGLVDGLRLHGYAEGQNLIVETRYAEGRFERLSELAAELVRLRCDVIVAAVTQASLAARDASATIPVVMIGVADPVAAGLVASLARPGGNVTGTSGATTQVVGKQLALLKETFPDVARVAVLWNPANRVYQTLQLREAEIAARALRVELQLIEARKPGDLERSFASIATRRPLLLMGDPLFNAHRRRITELATARRVPIVTSLREYAEAGPVHVRIELHRLGSALCRLCRPDPQRREARGPSRGGANKVRASHQPQDCQGTRPDDPAVSTAADGPDH
jgi:putative ABC transport system substrate-binding protein